jgi:FlaA1/EpsC-like NDP-sugar epimerase
MSFSRARLLQLLVDGAIILLAFALAYAIRFEGLPPRHFVKQFLLVGPYLVLLHLGLFIAFGVYRLVWRYINTRDLPRIGAALLSATVVMTLVRHYLPDALLSIGLRFNPNFFTVPYGVLAAHLVLAGGGIIFVRVLWRTITERSSAPTARAHAELRRAIVIGAGSAGVMIAREVAANPQVGFSIAGFVDDDQSKHGTIIAGHQVYGSPDKLPLLAQAHEAELAVIAITKAPATSVRRLVKIAEEGNLNVKIIPGLHDILSGNVNISKVRDVAIEDLLGRNPVQLEEDSIRRFLTGKRVLVTGAGGSIGREICRQVSRFSPDRLLILDQAENPIFHLLRELSSVSFETTPLIGSVTDREHMKQLIADYRPQVVFHAAAHKHVPLMEANPGEAVRNNVLGSRIIADLSHDYGVESFVMISTDKAVNPTSVMGACKRMAEMYIQSLAGQSNTRFLTVRFGNVLGSEGSVVPLFKQQIASGGPVTVTDSEMTRYFMTIPEASQLVLQAGAMGDGGEIFILEMGEPIKIVSLARDLIRLSGYRPDEDIEIVFTGMRPGEKLYEEINLNSEDVSKTKHPRVWVGSYQQMAHETATTLVDELVAMSRDASDDEMVAKLAEFVPEYAPERLQKVTSTRSQTHERSAVAG